MHATRQQRGCHDENNRVDQGAKPNLSSKGALVGAPTMAAGRSTTSRRALGDIGNLAGAMTARCRVSKENLPEVHKNLAVGKQVPGVDRPITRRCGANLTSRNVATKHISLVTREGLDSVNIDQTDINNQLAVVDYVEDIYSFYRNAEMRSCVLPDYMMKQEDVNHKMRAILMDWLIEVHLKFKLMPETLFLTTNLIDRYLCCQQVSRRLLQLVGVTAMLVAAKYEEIWAPEVQDFVFISDGAYTKDQILSMEKAILNTIQFNLAVPTPYVFMVRFLKAAAADQQMEMVAWYMIELCIQEYAMLQFPPSLLSAASIYSSFYALQRSPRWTVSLQHHSGYSEFELKECACMIVGFHAKASENSLKVVHKKYSSSKFLAVAKLSPATFPPPFCS